MNKETLMNVVDKYYLNGLCESVKWNVKDKQLSINAVLTTKNGNTFTPKLTQIGLLALYLLYDILKANLQANGLTSNHFKSFLLKSCLGGNEKKEAGASARLTLK